MTILFVDGCCVAVTILLLFRKNVAPDQNFGFNVVAITCCCCIIFAFDVTGQMTIGTMEVVRIVLRFFLVSFSLCAASCIISACVIVICL